MRQLLHRYAPVSGDGQSSVEFRHVMFRHDVIFIPAKLVLKEVSKLPAVQIESVADVRVDWRRDAVDVAIRCGEAQLKRGDSKPWRTVKDELARRLRPSRRKRRSSRTRGRHAR